MSEQVSVVPAFLLLKRLVTEGRASEAEDILRLAGGADADKEEARAILARIQKGWSEESRDE